MKLGLTALFISHNLGVIEHVSDSVIIMYLGRMVEKAKTEDLFLSPLHPYTQALLNGLTHFDKRRIKFRPVEGEIPSPFNPPSGCHFHPRCQIAVKHCRGERPLLREVATNHFVACHLV